MRHPRFGFDAAMLRIPTKWVDRFVILMSSLVPLIVAFLLITQLHTINTKAQEKARASEAACHVARLSNYQLLDVVGALAATDPRPRADTAGALKALRIGLDKRYVACLMSARAGR